MKSITVGELRQNPTAALKDVESGESYTVTRHRHAIAKIVPIEDHGAVPIVPARNPHAARLAERPPHVLRTATSVDDLLDDMRSPW